VIAVVVACPSQVVTSLDHVVGVAECQNLEVPDEDDHDAVGVDDAVDEDVADLDVVVKHDTLLYVVAVAGVADVAVVYSDVEVVVSLVWLVLAD
jgi:hypothetical protein